MDESDLSGNFTNEYVFFGGKRIAVRNVSSGTIDYYTEDMLGSSRTIVQAGQTTPCYDADFYPFGGERDVTVSCVPNYTFEGKERDSETQNDDFGARYYSWRVGRWLSADWSAVPVPVPYANLTNPQTLNLYAMVRDNPETFADLDGHNNNEGAGNGGDPGFCSGDKTTGVGCQFILNHNKEFGIGQGSADKAGSAGESPQQNNDQNQDQQDQNQPQTPFLAMAKGGKGRPGKGERRHTAKPDDPGKHARPIPGKPGRWQVRDPHTGKWIPKPPGWSPDTKKRVILGVEVGTGAYITYRVIRMVPSLFPALWETIPANAAIP
ncbi:MAG TPA: RHS repeat-associated core domain-containing protein [Candidatus Acidoferrales bacterium]|nr:RHS repeat-associated core domain-containing protein [Candidatus Acidoferrales bacterium]